MKNDTEARTTITLPPGTYVIPGPIVIEGPLALVKGTAPVASENGVVEDVSGDTHS